MGEFTDKVKGAFNQAVGQAKQDVADSGDVRTEADDRLAGEGAMQELKGHAQELKGKIKGVINDL
jgi:uncharacterized protein YjbJ (UPF0337 family)